VIRAIIEVRHTGGNGFSALLRDDLQIPRLKSASRLVETLHCLDVDFCDRKAFFEEERFDMVGDLAKGKKGKNKSLFF
jgi:hypothetical protein